MTDAAGLVAGDYHRESATDGWRRLPAWFKQHGAA
jgi:hypothetical protein